MSSRSDTTDGDAPAGFDSQEPPDVCVIPLRRRDGSVRAVTLVDPEDLERFGGRKWFAQKRARGGYYAVGHRTVDGKHLTVLLHREILGLEAGDRRQGDHINRDGLDNRRENLRIVANQGEQLQNVPARGGTSRFRGVSHAGSLYTRKPWVANVQHNGRKHNLGYFATEIEAADAAAAFRREHMPYATE